MSLRSAAASALTRAVQFTKEKLGVDEGELTEYDRHFDLLADRAGEWSSDASICFHFTLAVGSIFLLTSSSF